MILYSRLAIGAYTGHKPEAELLVTRSHSEPEMRIPATFVQDSEITKENVHESISPYPYHFRTKLIKETHLCAHELGHWKVLKDLLFL